MSNVFDSRSAAREKANAEGMKVVDRGSHLKQGRWMVVPKDSKGATQRPSLGVSFENFVNDRMKGFLEKVVRSSRFFASRGEARDFAKTVKNAKIIDHSKTLDGFDKNEGVVKDLGKQGKRWEVIYYDNEDVYVEAPVVELPEPVSVGVAVPEEKQDPVVIMTGRNVMITMPDGTQYSMSREDEVFSTVGALLLDGDIEGAVQMIVNGKEMTSKSVVDLGPNLKLLDGVLYWHGIKQESTIAKRIINDIENDTFDNRYVLFMQRLMNNPSYASVSMLYDFIKHNDLEIMEDGRVKAYKRIKIGSEGPRDSATGKVPNFKGQTITMPRNLVEDNPQITCSHGLHVASIEYAKDFTGNTLIEVAVDPADVVSVPYDYDQQKCRCCRYEVLTGTEKPEGEADVIVVGHRGEILEQLYIVEEITEED